MLLPGFPVYFVHVSLCNGWPLPHSLEGFPFLAVFRLGVREIPLQLGEGHRPATEYLTIPLLFSFHIMSDQAITLNLILIKPSSYQLLAGFPETWQLGVRIAGQPQFRNSQASYGFNKMIIYQVRFQPPPGS